MIFHMDKHHGLLTNFDFGDADDEEDILQCIQPAKLDNLYRAYL